MTNADPSQAPGDDSRRAVRLAAILTLVLCVAGAVAIPVVAKYELWRKSIFYEQFAAIEAPGIAIVASFAIVVLVLASIRHSEAVGDPDSMRHPGRSEGKGPAIGPVPIAIAVLAITLAGTFLVFHNYAFVDDEFSGLFQGIIYSRGQRSAALSEPWCHFATALQPSSIVVSTKCTWQLGYFPVHALIRGAFDAVRSPAFAEPVMAALSVLLLFNLVRRVWPERPQRAMLSALFLAASTEFLLTSMTAFSMPAHLLASILWLWLYIRPERWALVVLPWLGVVAIGVHSPFPHVLFVTPFVLSFLFRRKYSAFAYVSIVYIIGSLAWVARLYRDEAAMMPASQSAVSIARNASGTFAHPAGDGITASMSIASLATWSVPIAILCVIVSILLWNRLDRFARWLALSLVFTLVARAILFGTYGAGWGHRYAYAVLGNVAILAAIGVERVEEAIGTRATYRLVAAAFIAAVVVQLPMRAIQAERIVRPYYEASRYLESIPADVVVVQFEGVQWGRQLLRNDPFLRNRPKLMSYSELKPSGLDSLRKLFPNRVKVVPAEELTRFGVKRATRIGRFEIR